MINISPSNVFKKCCCKKNISQIVGPVLAALSVSGLFRFRLEGLQRVTFYYAKFFFFGIVLVKASRELTKVRPWCTGSEN